MTHKNLLSRLATLFGSLSLLATPYVSAEAISPSAELPLQDSAAELEFSTQTGSWISVDVTPDGENLIFDLLGDIYSLPILGGKAMPITQGMGFDSQPAVSPSGDHIAFISDRNGSRNLWIARIDGSEARMLSDESQWEMISPSWSPDGQYVLVLRNGAPRELVSYHVNGGSGVSIGGPDDDPPWGVGAVIDKDNRYAYLAMAADSTRPVDNFPSMQIARLDLLTGKKNYLTQGIGGGVRPILSPDGAKMVYGTRYDGATGLRIRDLESGDDRWLTYPVQRDAQENYRPPSRDLLPGYAFSPDGSAVVFSADTRLWKVDTATGDRAEIPFEVDVKLAVGPDLTAPYSLYDDSFVATLAEDPALSPNGKRVAASILGKVYVMDAKSGSTPKRLNNQDSNQYKPTWSPDGNWIVYSTWSDLDGGYLWRARSNGRGEPKRITTAAAFYTDVAFHPSGDRLFAMRGNGFQRQQTFSEFGGIRLPLELVEVDLQTGDVEAIMPADGLRNPHFGSDVSRLYLNDDDGLVSIQLDGTDLREELRVSAPMGNRRSEDPPGPSSMRVSPDGQYALAHAVGQIWVMPTAVTGGKAAKIDLRGPSLPLVRLTDIGADSFGWTSDSAGIWWSIGHSFYQRDLASLRWREEDDEADSELDDKDCSCDEPEPESDELTAETKLEVLEDSEHVDLFDIELTVARDIPQGDVLLRNLNLISMSASTTDDMAQVQRNTSILIRAGRIHAVGPEGSFTVPAGTDERDLGGRYVLPGLIDTHAHWEFRTDDVLEPHTWSLAANLAYGVTTGLDVQTATEDYFAYRDMVESGQTIGQRALMTGPGIFGNTDFETYEAAHAYLRRYADHYNTHNIKAYLSGNRRQRQWIVQASKALGLLPTTEGGGDAQLDITHAIDGMHGNEHTLPDHPLGDDVIQLYARTRTAYTPTLIVQYNAESMREYFFTRHDIHDDPKLRRFYPSNRLDELTERRPGWQRDEEFQFREAAADAARIQRAGGLVGVGGHAELQGLGYHWEMWALAMGGMTNAEVLRAATIDGAAIIGVANDLGSVEVGKLADLVVLSENPLEDIRNTTSIDYVVKAGRVYHGETLDEEWPRNRPFPPFWWWGESAKPKLAENQ